MKNVVWCTDIHLDHAQWVDTFCDNVRDLDPDYILLGGDISNGKNIIHDLDFLSNQFDKSSLYFVLGNHDYYGSSFTSIDHDISELLERKQNLFWLNTCEPIKLNSDTYLIGNGLWCDWRAGDISNSTVWLNDYQLIEEFWKAQVYTYAKGLGGMKDTLKPIVQTVAKNCTNNLHSKLQSALDCGAKNIIILTHVPPFWEASFYQGKVQDSQWAPHFVCEMAGNRILYEAKSNEHVEFNVLCGHCFDEETEILTRNGWKKREELKIGTEVVSWNKETKELEYDPILSFADYDYNGEMCKIKTKVIDLFVTPGHGLVDVGREMNQINLFNAQDFHNKYEYQFLTSGIMNKPGVNLTDDEIRLIVWISADGSFENRKNYVRFHFRKSRKIERLKELLANLNVPFVLKKQNKGTTKISFNLSKTTIGHLFNSVKQLPSIISMVNFNQAQVVLEEYKNTDGCKSKKENEQWFQIFTTKECEADLLQSIAVLNGMRCSKYKRLEKSGNYGFILTLIPKQSTRVNRKQYSVMSYKGYVWCVTVSNGTLLVRRNGKTCITQNTHGKGQADILSNLHVYNGGAEYGWPAPQNLIILSEEGWKWQKTT